MRFNDAFHFSRSTKREKTMRHRVVSKDNRTGSKVLLLLRETNEAMETSSSRKRFALPPLSPLFFLDFRLPRFVSPFPSARADTRVFPLFNHTERRIDAYRNFSFSATNRTKNNLFLLLDVSGDATKTSLSLVDSWCRT